MNVMHTSSSAKEQWTCVDHQTEQSPSYGFQHHTDTSFLPEERFQNAVGTQAVSNYKLVRMLPAQLHLPLCAVWHGTTIAGKAKNLGRAASPPQRS